MSIINMTLVCDGSSDICLQDVIQWLMDTNFPDIAFRIVPAKEVIPARDPLHHRLSRAYELYQPDLILCHRDAEAVTLEDRVAEIANASELLDAPVPIVPLVPVRMLESWLLVDEPAIRCAANNRNGTTPLQLPTPDRIERLPDPKAKLFDLLKIACDLPPQRLRRFNVEQSRSRVTGFMQSFEPLRQQQGFQRFEQSFIDAVGSLTKAADIED